MRRTTTLDAARDFERDRERYFFVFAGIVWLLSFLK